MKNVTLAFGGLVFFGLGFFTGGMWDSGPESEFREGRSVLVNGSSGSMRVAQRNSSSAREDSVIDQSKPFRDELARVMGIANFPERRDIFEKLMEDFTPDQGPDFVAAILESDLSGASNGNEWQKLFFHWGEDDPEGAIAFLENTDTSQWHRWAKSGGLYHVYVGWSEKDAAAAFKSATETGLVARDRNVLGPLMSNWAQQDTPAVTNFILEQPDDRFDGHLGSITEIIARRDGKEGLVQWQRDVISRKPELKTRVDGIVADFMRHKPPKEAVSWVVEETQDRTGRIPINAANRAYSAMSSHYPEKGPEFLAELSVHQSAKSAMHYLVEKSVKQSPSLLKNWLKEREGDASLNILRAAHSRAAEKANLPKKPTIFDGGLRE